MSEIRIYPRVCQFVYDKLFTRGREARRLLRLGEATEADFMFVVSVLRTMVDFDKDFHPPNGTLYANDRLTPPSVS